MNENKQMMQQVIAGLAACQRTVELLQSVYSSKDRIQKLTDKVNALDNKNVTLHMISGTKVIARSQHTST